MTARVLAWVLAAILAACASLGIDPPDAAPIAPDVRLRLPPPVSLGRRIEAVQLVSLRHGDTRFAFEARISVTAERLLLVGLDPAGRRAMTLTWDGRRLVSALAPFVPAGFRAEAMLGDIVFIFWPPAAVAASLEPADARLTGDGARRVLTLDERELVEARYLEGAPGAWSARVSYRNLGWGYDLEIQSMEVEGS